MNVVVVDTNIIFSALIGRSSAIVEIIVGSKEKIQFYTSDYMRVELQNHHEKLKKISKLSDEEISVAQYELFKYVKFITLAMIPQSCWQEAEKLVFDIDIDDTAFVALSLYLDAYLWTGDKVLYNGLKAKGFNKVITTSELKHLLNRD
jgi:predicted nucleic acid-binding protein